ncbi:MAG: YggS family pyridoxal phosphate-dependent enzyme [Betaproteobacteria bacterium]|nr:YggS family pyridoxal phosphate-dependent enzyme [Betaproteobacteria bacterium]
MTRIASRLQAVRSRIDAAAVTAGRSPWDIRLIAVSKTFAPVAIAEAHAAGQVAFGENYLQEAVGKIAALADLGLEWHVAHGKQDDERREGDVRPSAGVRQRDVDGALGQAVELAHGSASSVARAEAPRSGASSPQAGPLLLPLEWHFIGPIQSNKTRQIAEQFHWVHSVDRLKIAERLSFSRPTILPPLQICIQVNVSGEESKSGIRPDEVLALAKAASRLTGIRLRGLMAIPEPTPDIGLQRARFRLLRQLRDETVSRGVPLDTLSMGMSDDLEAAIAEGATLVRVGRAIFGERLP